MMQSFNVLMPLVETLPRQITDLKIRIASSKNNPAIVAHLNSELAKKQAMLLVTAPVIVSEMKYWAEKFDDDDRPLDRKYSDKLANSVREAMMVSASQQQLSVLLDQIRGEENSARLEQSINNTTQVAALVRSANALREQLLQGSPLTPEDEKNAAVFFSTLVGQPLNWGNMRKITEYMDKLVQDRLAVSANP